MTQVTARQCSQLLGLISVFIVHVHLFNRSGPNSQPVPKRDNHPSFHSCDIIKSYFTDMMSLLRNTTFYFQKVFINAEVFCFFFPLVWPEHLELGNFRVQKYSQDVADRITTHNISLRKREQIKMWGTSSHNQLLKIKAQRSLGGMGRQEVWRARRGQSCSFGWVPSHR